MLNKVCLWVGGKFKMLFAGIVSLVASFVLGVYGNLSLHPPFMLSYLFRWLPISRSYKSAFEAILQLETIHPLKRGYYDDAFGIPKQEVGKIDSTNKGFRELIEAIKMAGITNQAVDVIELKQSTDRLSGNVTLILTLFKDDKVVKELIDRPTEILRNAIEKASQRKFAILMLALTAILFVIGIILILIDIRSRQ